MRNRKRIGVKCLGGVILVLLSLTGNAQKQYFKI